MAKDKTAKIKALEKILGTTQDGMWGDDDKAALKMIVGKEPKAEPPVKANAGVSDVQMSGPAAPPQTYS